MMHLHCQLCTKPGTDPRPSAGVIRVRVLRAWFYFAACTACALRHRFGA